MKRGFVFCMVFVFFVSVVSADFEFEKKWESQIFSGGSPTGISYADIDRDGFDEIVFGVGSHIYIVSSEGELVNKIMMGGWIDSFTPVSIANLDDDSELELVALVRDGSMYKVVAYQLSGELYWERKLENEEFKAEDCNSAPAVSDIDIDGKNEVILPCDRYVWGFTHDGRDEPGWPVDLFDLWIEENWGDGIRDYVSPDEFWQKYYYRFGVSISPAIGNLDEDSQLEIVIGASMMVFTLNHDGTYFWSTDRTGDHTTVAIANLDEEGFPEIIVGTAQGGIIGAYTNEGELYWADEEGDLFDIRGAMFMRGIPIGRTNIPGLAVLAHSTTPIGDSDFYLIDFSGQFVDPFDPLKNEGAFGSPGGPIVSDFDGDGYFEILTYGAFNIFGVESICSSAPCKRIAVAGEEMRDDGGIVPVRQPLRSSPAIGDFDGDHHLDWVGVGNGKVFMYTDVSDELEEVKLDWPMYLHDAMHTSNYATPIEIMDSSATGFIRGDANGDGGVNVGDAINILNYLFAGGTDQVKCEDAADINDDGNIAINDAILLLNHLFAGGEVPKAPYPDPGVDPSEDGLSCG